MAEGFKPIAIRAPGDNPLLFAVRCAVDLQLLTTYRFLAPNLRACRGKVLDVGAGQAPWRELLSGAEYVGLDVESANDFGMHRQPDVVYYDGGTMPFPDVSFDHVMCSEVLEHVPDSAAFMSEVARVLKPGGSLVLTVPWSARLHHVPHDYVRFTRYGLERLIGAAGFVQLRIEERGNDVTAVANKLIVMCIRLLRPRRAVDAIWAWPLMVIAGPIAVGVLIAAHASMLLGLGSREDPLGYGVVAVRA